MTIINNQNELDIMTKEGELDIKMGNTFTFKEVYSHLYSKKEDKQYV